MKLMEYQAQTLFKQFGLPVQPGCVAERAEEVISALEREGLSGPLVVKAQVQIGGGGKGGGIQFGPGPGQARGQAGRRRGGSRRGRQDEKRV